MALSAAGQRAKGNYIAQAAGASTAIVNVYQSADAASVDEDALAEAEELLAGLPLGEVPEPSGVPTGSRMPWRRNALFVGRETDLKALATALQTGGTAHSDAKRPLIPIQSGHRFRFKAATDSDAKRPVRLGL
jgi:hypothetical protein